MDKHWIIVCAAVGLTIGCGTFVAPGDDAGDPAAIDASRCPGDVDTDGNCVCPARTAGAICDECAPGWSGATCSVFADDFNRAAGALGAIWERIPGPGTSDPLIVNNRACGDIQSAALLVEELDTRSLTASVTFEAANIEGLEASVLFLSTVDASAGLFVAGCDGGGGECNLRLGDTTQAPLDETILTANFLVTYTLTLTIVDGMASLVLRNPDATTVGTVSGTLPDTFRVRRLGFITGRNPDGALTCVDNFSLELM